MTINWPAETVLLLLVIVALICSDGTVVFAFTPFSKSSSLILASSSSSSSSSSLSPLTTTTPSSPLIVTLSSSSDDNEEADSVTTTIPKKLTTTTRKAPPKATTTPEEDELLGQQTFGGYTVKQRLREEVESPFRPVRLFFFASTAGSAAVALYFSSLAALKASIGGYEDAIPLDDALQTCAINLAGVVGCSLLAYREWQVGESNLKRIAKGGALARLKVEPAATAGTGLRSALGDYRRNARVLIAAGGKEYLNALALSLTSDQLSDINDIPQKLEDVDVILVPVLLEKGKRVAMEPGATRDAWRATVPSSLDTDRNFDITRADNVVAFPVGTPAWQDYLESELSTAEKQGFDYLTKGITITVKKNGKILRRATGQPQWGYVIGAMETLDGSRFGMPGDSEKYGGA